MTSTLFFSIAHTGQYVSSESLIAFRMSESAVSLEFKTNSRNIFSKDVGCWSRMCIALSICMILIGVPLLCSSCTLERSGYLIYYSLIMAAVGVIISFIDIPLLFILQTTISDDFRGRILSLGMSMAKAVSPVALIISGLLVSALPPYTLPMIGGILLLMLSMFYAKGNLLHPKQALSPK